MTYGPLVLVGIHMFLYVSWKLPAIREKHTRPDRALIPNYYSGDFGNPIGFTLVAFAAGSVIGSASLTAWFIAVCFAGLFTYIPDRYWRRVALTNTESLYTKEGTDTPAGILHLLYMLFVITISVLTILNAVHLSMLSASLFASGMLFYVFTVVADRTRGVI